jgi:hypothetical protein
MRISKPESNDFVSCQILIDAAKQSERDDKRWCFYEIAKTNRAAVLAMSSPMQKSSASCGRRTEDGITTFHFYCSCELANRMPKGRHWNDLRFAFSKASNRSHRSNLGQVSLRAIPASLADAAENAKTHLATDARWNPFPSRSHCRWIGNTMQKPEFARTILSAAIDKHAARHTLKIRPTMKLVGAEEM